MWRDMTNIVLKRYDIKNIPQNEKYTKCPHFPYIYFRETFNLLKIC